MPYRQVWTSLWTEDWFSGLPATAKLVYVYLLTADNTRPTGILERSARRVALDLGLAVEDVQDAIAHYGERVRYWGDYETWWVVRYPVWQGKGSKWTACVRKAAQSLVVEIRRAFYQVYPEWCDTPSDTPCKSSLEKVSHQQTTPINQQTAIGTHAPRAERDLKIKFADVVFLTQGEYQKLTAQFGEPGAKDRIEGLALYIKSKGKQYKDHYATILNWERMKAKEGKDNGRTDKNRGLPGNAYAGAFDHITTE